MNGNLLGRPRAAGGLDGPEPSEAGLDYRHKVEQDLLQKINSTLGPLLGENKFRAGVSVEVDFSGGEQSEEVFRSGPFGNGEFPANRGQLGLRRSQWRSRVAF